MCERRIPCCTRCGKKCKNGDLCAKCKKIPITVSPFLQEILENYYAPNHKPEIWLHEWFDGKKWIPLFHLCYPTKKEAQWSLWTRWPGVRSVVYDTDVYNEQVAKKHIPLWFRKKFRVRKYKPQE